MIEQTDLDHEGYAVVYCHDADVLLNQLSPQGEHFERFKYPDSWIFRGQKDAGWKLIPSSLRESFIQSVPRRNKSQ